MRGSSSAEHGLIILQIAARRSERRIMIFETFETLPIVIEKVQRSHVLYPGSFELREKALAVYFDILTMTEAMIATLMEKRFCKWREGPGWTYFDLSC